MIPDKYHNQRLKMVKMQIQARGISNIHVLRTLEEVPRHLFVPDDLKDHAYEDSPLPIGYGQTISQPYIVAFMTEALSLRADMNLLEIGTGSGYQAAVLSKMVKAVYTVEIVKELAESARKLFQQLGYTHIYVKAGNGYQGWREAAPFDAIMVTAAADHMVSALLDQLKVNGVMVMPLKKKIGDQLLVHITKLDKDNHYKQEELLPVRFVPMTGENTIPSPASI